ncbi:MAG: VCBS repeat-containing protein [bacterium]|nr:VCBS repeat-containing protein [bacterium]
MIIAKSTIFFTGHRLKVPVMKKHTLIQCIALLIFCTLSFQGFAADFIADYTKAKESVLRSIPEEYINAAKSNLHIMYCGTSHSSQTADGLRGLMEYKSGDSTLYAVTFKGTPAAGSLDIHYRPSTAYSAGRDLSNDGLDANGHTPYYRATVDYLDNPSYADINVVMWSWCSIEGHYYSRYLDNFQELIDMYKAGGSKGRTSANEVKFVFMTGYARGSDGDTPESPYIRSPYQNHKRIVDYCKANGYFCLDYWSQDTYHYETDAYNADESGNNNSLHKSYFDSHSEGEHWFATRNYSSGSVKWPAHCDGLPQHITSNRRAYAAWWIFARLAGWSGEASASTETTQYIFHTNNFDGSGGADIAIYRPAKGSWHVRGQATQRWGTATDIPVPGDYDGDGVTELAVYRPSSGLWCIKGQLSIPWGTSEDIPVPGDYDGDGTTDIAIYRPSKGIWCVRGESSVAWGTSTDIPIPGDYDGDGDTDFAVYRPSTGRWCVRGQASVAWGAQGDMPVPGDYNGDGSTEIAIYRPSSGRWCVLGNASVAWGASDDVPVPADYNGDGSTQFAIYRPSSGRWCIQGQTSIPWGTSSDIPLVSHCE